jgi:U3 small nucleolar RNA-associated protein 20
MVVQMLIPDLEEPDRHATTFALIRAILSRKHVFPEMYTLMQSVLKLTVTSQSSQIQELCRYSFIQFLTEYPHGSKSLRKQINYIVNNLEYEFESGRDSTLCLLDSLIQKFSDEILFEYSELFFCSLVMSLVNDDSAKCRERCGKTLQNLLKRLNNQKLDHSILLLEKWFSNKAQISLQRAAIQVFGLMIESLGAQRCKKYLITILSHLSSALEIAGREITDEQAVESVDEEERQVPVVAIFWELGYYALKSLAKALLVFPGEVSAMGELWIRVKTLLPHPHLWIKHQASRLLGHVFSTMNPEEWADVVLRSKCQKNGLSSLLGTAGLLMELADLTRRQLFTPYLTEELADQVLKNLLFIGRCLAIAETLEGDEVIEGGGTDDEIRKPPTLLGLYNKMAFMSRGDISTRKRPLLVKPFFLFFLHAHLIYHCLQRKTVFNWFKEMTTHVPADRVAPYLFPAMSVLYRSVQDVTTKGKEIGESRPPYFYLKLIHEIDELRDVAKEVMDHLNKHAGVTAYLEVYNKLHMAVKDVQQERRIKRKIQVCASSTFSPFIAKNPSFFVLDQSIFDLCDFKAVVDPEASAKRKVQKQQMKKAGRKRRSEEMAQARLKLGISKRVKTH